ncbi:FAD-dependent thymidylate synthase [candidate division KSB1 bacterium]|nr:FAD-dependent thymidylate synthase [candidate division KSB1 bacterium]
MALFVRLAGFNIDADLLADVVETIQQVIREAPSPGSGSGGDPRALVEQLGAMARERLSVDSFTPETISAAYARISRDPSHVSELRQSARFGVARARKSNETIIFGLGHASVAEHACFNFDVSGISRLASEELQSHRLASFTEKSQRYITIGSEYVLPPEAVDSDVAREFIAAMPELFRTYDRLTTTLSERYVSQAAPDASRGQIRDLETRAKEDTRYLLPLACATQMGMTMNARNVEHVVCELSDHPLQELRDLGRAIANAVGPLAPSLVKYTVRGDYPRRNRERLSQSSRGTAAKQSGPLDVFSGPRVRIISHTPDAESRILAGIRFTSGHGAWPHELPDAADAAVWLEVFRSMGAHDPALREFELASITFEAEVSASCFAQLKRHRMMTLLHQAYELDAGIVLPPSIREARLDAEFLGAAGQALQAARRVAAHAPLLASYLLTNAHRKRVVMQANARELYHFSRLRCDAHAQWEIRELGQQMMDQASRLWPRVFLLACGKDKYQETYERVFGAE